MAVIVQGGNPTLLAASGAVSTVPGTIIGFYVASTTGGTIVIRDGGSAGTAISGTITPAVGYHPFPASCGAGCYATIANTISVTFFYSPGA